MVNNQAADSGRRTPNWNAIYAGMRPGELAEHEVLVDHSGRNEKLRGTSTFRARLVIRRKDVVSTARAQKAIRDATGRGSGRLRIRDC